jgi:hypothetical protein
VLPASWIGVGILAAFQAMATPIVLPDFRTRDATGH